MATAAEMRETRLAEDLMTALGRTDQLAVHYMPTVALSTGECTGVEALARWEHPAFGTISPADFVPISERFGLAPRLGEYVRAQVMRDAFAGRLSSDQVAINVSGSELSDRHFVDRLLDLMKQGGMNTEQLTVEVTETAVAPNAARAIEALLRLRAAGVRVAIDDFGTGHASLDYLATLPCDVVKIDRGFTAGLGTNPRCTAIVRGVISMGHALDLKVIAEGVETATQRSDLSKLKCDEGQGYLFGKALAAGPVTEREPSRPSVRLQEPVVRRQRKPQSGGQVLVDLARDLAFCTDVEEAFTTTMHAIRQHVEFTGGSIQLVGSDGLRMVAAHPPLTQEAREARLPIGQGIGGTIVETQQLRYIPDITALSAAVPKQRRRASTTRDTVSYLGIPLVVAGTTIGLLQIDSVAKDAFGLDAELLVTGCASILAHAGALRA